MAAPILDATSTIMCPHGASAVHPPSQARVLINGSPALVSSDLGQVAGCPFQLPAGPTPSPCVTVQWLTPAVRVRASGQPVLLQTSTGLCKSAQQAPQGPPLVVAVQPRVKGI